MKNLQIVKLIGKKVSLLSFFNFFYFNNTDLVSESGIEDDIAPTNEYDIVNSDEISLQENDNDNKNKSSIYNSPGFIQLQASFINLLKDFILILPDSSVEEVLNHYVTIDILIILSNHRDGNVRAAIVRLLSIICDRNSSNISTASLKLFYWNHLGNQISLYPANLNLVNACIQWLTGHCTSLEQLMSPQFIEIQQINGFNTLIAILPQTIHDFKLATITFQVVEKIYNKNQDCNNYMIENGLIPSTIKALAKCFNELNKNNLSSVESINRLLATIAYKSMISTGSIHVSFKFINFFFNLFIFLIFLIKILWDLLNCLSHTEQNRTGEVSSGVRSAQATVLKYLLQTCINSTKNPISLLNFKIKSKFFHFTEKKICHPLKHFCKLTIFCKNLFQEGKF